MVPFEVESNRSRKALRPVGPRGRPELSYGRREVCRPVQACDWQLRRRRRELFTQLTRANGHFRVCVCNTRRGQNQEKSFVKKSGQKLWKELRKKMEGGDDSGSIFTACHNFFKWRVDLNRLAGEDVNSDSLMAEPNRLALR